MDGENNSAVSTKWEGETTGEALDALRAILAEMRKQANEPTIESLGEVIPPVGAEDVLDWADRIEAAAERVKVAHCCECERKRLLIGRLAQRVQFARLADPNPGGEDYLLREAQYELAGTPYAVIDGKPVVVLHGRVAQAPDGRTFVVNRPNCGMEANNG